MDMDQSCLSGEKNSKMIAESSEVMVEQNRAFQDCDDVFGDDSEIEWAFEDLISAKLQSESTSSIDIHPQHDSESSESGGKTASLDSLDQLSSSPKREHSSSNLDIGISDDSGNDTHSNNDDDNVFGDDSDIEWVFTDPSFLVLQSKLANSMDDESMSNLKSSEEDEKDMEFSSGDSSSIIHPRGESSSTFDQDAELFDDSLDEIMSSIQISSNQSIELSVASSGCTSEKCVNYDNESDEHIEIKAEENILDILDTKAKKRTIESFQDDECPKSTEKNMFENWPKKKKIMEHSDNTPSCQVIGIISSNDDNKIIPSGENYTKEARLIIIAVKSFIRSKNFMTFAELENALKGPQRKKIRRRAYQSIDGLLKHVRRSKILHILEHMKTEGYLEEIERKDKFVLKPGPKADGLLSSGCEEEQFIVPILPSDEAKFQCESSKEKTQQRLAPVFQKNQRIEVQRVNQKDLEEKCYEELRKLTLSIADERGIDPCRLLPNDSLKQLSKKLPKSRLEMQEIYGISSSWYEAMGSRYQEICSKYSSIRKTFVR
ncbi:uncharacterized protein LOC141853611 [Brevipalpus obovatus]|uniref:uncharacterized protein LOC141853611 n=1 Tax=Brevipalpus obovatus TaxID=246614 RepID=UPI003D9E0503